LLLARQAATRDRQVAFVSDIAPHDVSGRSITPERGSCTGYSCWDGAGRRLGRMAKDADRSAGFALVETGTLP
jgi:hypothetical protein